MAIFNFVSGKKEFNGNYIKMKENSILLIEGLHCLNDDLLPGIDNKYINHGKITELKKNLNLDIDSTIKDICKYFNIQE